VVRIERGKLYCYRVFDAGDTIALEIVEKVLAGHRVEMGGPLVDGFVVPVRPVEVDLGCVAVTIGALGRPLQAVCVAHLYDFGAISIRFEIAIEKSITFESLTPICERLYEAVELDSEARRLCDVLVQRMGDGIAKPHNWRDGESYTIVFVEQLSGVTDLSELTRSQSVAKLLLGESSSKPLSDATRDDALKHSFSYLADDLVIVDWNSALVVEPTGSTLVPFVLELATSQLLEFRYYDEILESELAHVYNYVEKARPRIWRSPYGALTRQVMRRFLEITEFTERVDNSIKSVGDFYLARVYQRAIERFRVQAWRESVESKLALIARAYELLKGEVEVSRAQLLEVIVVLLIAIELLAALRLGH